MVLGIKASRIGDMCSCCDNTPTSTAAEATASNPSSRIDAMHELVKTFEPRLSWDEYFMATAFLIAGRSPCHRLHVGCVLVTAGNHPNRIIATGYNGFLPGAPHTSRIQESKVDGSKHELSTVHAEQNAIADAARRGVNVGGATAYVTYYPCINCTKVMVAAGISEVKYHLDYHNDPVAGELFADAGVKVTKI